MHTVCAVLPDSNILLLVHEVSEYHRDLDVALSQGQFSNHPKKLAMHYK